MNWFVNRSLFRVPLAGTIPLVVSTHLAAMPVSLYPENVAISVWDTDPTKVGVTLQIGNNGTALADHVRVTSVVVRGGALSGSIPLPIAIGRIAPNGSALLNLVINVPGTDGTAYRMTISGTYTYSGSPHDFLLDRTITPNSAVPGPARARSGVTAKGPSAQTPLGPTPPAAASPPLGPNATTPMLIPVGPPRQLTLPNPAGTDSIIKNR